MTSKIRTNIGKITTPHGLKGAFKIFCYTKTPKDLLQYQEFFDKNDTPLELKFLSTKGKFLIATTEESTSCEAAESFRDTEIFVDLNHEDINEAEFFFEELSNMDVINEKSEKIGTISSIENFGAGDIIEIKFLNNKTAMYPFTEESFPVIDRSNNKITFIPPEEI